MTNAPIRVFDGHNDTLLDLQLEDRGGGRSFFERSETGHVDLPRAREGNFGGGCFAVFVPNDDEADDEENDDDAYSADAEYEMPAPLDHDYAKAFTYDALALLHRLAAESEADAETGGTADFRVVGTAADLEACLDGDAVAAVPHLEGAEAVAPDLSNLDFLYAAGVRSIGLVWSRPNAFGHGTPVEYDASPDIGPGLTDAGRELVRACNDRGIVVDLAHLNAAGFRDVEELSDDPLVVSHAAVHDICPTARNLTDDQLDAVADSGGLVGITFAASFLRPDGRNDTDVPVSTLADHVEYVADRIGVEHVALGSDFDGASIPDFVGDVTGLPDVIAEIRNRGFDEDEVQAIARDNWLRVFRETWE